MSDIRALLHGALKRLEGESARLESELLLGHALGRSRAWLHAHADLIPADDARARFDALVDARVRGRPIAYLTGRREFWSLSVDVTPDVLIPRPESERLVELALERIAPDAECTVADLGTGSGAIALAIARERPRARVIATDVSAAALAVARANAARLGVGNIAFAAGDWCAALGTARCDAIVSNPPYVRSGDVHLEQGDLRFEPRLALAAGGDGLDAIRSIVHAAPRHLDRTGWLLLEHGHDQGESVRALLAGSGFAAVETARDLAGSERVTTGRWRREE
ncbi:MAG TPA: peptide chain release factor N(5)-glutamine methyltransferase [Rhodanobacteraceae bacterium]|nr:peptide chain release factor N(5)-glutamine methyltransferase [Rhodanobacteraceae bacterium]